MTSAARRSPQSLLDPAGQTRWEARVATPRDDYDATLDAIAHLVAQADAAAGAARASVGIGIPGAVSPATGLIKNANSTWLNGRDLHGDLERRLGRQIRLANDANCLAMSEAIDGAAAGANVVFAVILGTGTGGGLAVGGRVITGANAIAGEWGHNPLPWPRDDERPGPTCYCGLRGCIETYVSGPGIAADYVRRGGRARTPEQIAEEAATGDPIAVGTLEAWTERVARALASIINIVDPEVIVVGGGLSRLDVLYTQVPSHWIKWVFSDRVQTRLVPARFGDASGVRGAAWLWGLPETRANQDGMLL